MENEKQIREVKLILSKIAEGIADLISSINCGSVEGVNSNIKYIKAGANMLDREYINEFGGGIYALKGYDRSNLSAEETARYKATIATYRRYKEIANVAEALWDSMRNEKPDEDEAKLTVTQRAKRKIKIIMAKRELGKIKKRFDTEALMLEKLE